MNGDSIVSIQRVNLPGSNATEAGFFVATPVDWTGLTQPVPGQGPILVSLNDASWNANQTDDLIEIFSLELNWRDPDSTRFVRQSVPVSPYEYPGTWYKEESVYCTSGNGTMLPHPIGLLPRAVRART